MDIIRLCFFPPNMWMGRDGNPAKLYWETNSCTALSEIGWRACVHNASCRNPTIFLVLSINRQNFNILNWFEWKWKKMIIMWWNVLLGRDDIGIWSRMVDGCEHPTEDCTRNDPMAIWRWRMTEPLCDISRCLLELFFSNVVVVWICQNVVYRSVGMLEAFTPNFDSFVLWVECAQSCTPFSRVYLCLCAAANWPWCVTQVKRNHATRE